MTISTTWTARSVDIINAAAYRHDIDTDTVAAAWAVAAAEEGAEEADRLLTEGSADLIWNLADQYTND